MRNKPAMFAKLVSRRLPFGEVKAKGIHVVPQFASSAAPQPISQALLLSCLDFAQKLMLLLPLLGEGGDGGARGVGSISALAPTPALPQRGREKDDEPLCNCLKQVEPTASRLLRQWRCQSLLAGLSCWSARPIPGCNAAALRMSTGGLCDLLIICGRLGSRRSGSPIRRAARWQSTGRY